MNTITTNSIVFITGAFISHHIWDEWIAWFENKGYTCIAPPWPHKEGAAKELRERMPGDTALAGLRLQQVLDHYTDIIKKLPEKPVLIGHSLGGLLAQLLVNKDLVAAGVAIHSVPPHGAITFEWSSIRSILKPLGFLAPSKKTYLMSPKEWKFAFTNGMEKQEQLEAYEKYVIPESRLVLRDALTKVAKVDFKKLHPPLLFLSGTGDNTTPEPVNYANYQKYDLTHSVTDYKEFSNRNHFVLGLPTWQEEAEYIIDWLQVVNA